MIWLACLFVVAVFAEKQPELGVPSNLRLELNSSHILKVTWLQRGGESQPLHYCLFSDVDNVFNSATWSKKHSISPEKPIREGDHYKYNVELRELQKDVEYVYQVGSGEVRSPVYSFNIRNNSSGDLTFVAVGPVADNDLSDSAIAQIASRNLLRPITTMITYKSDSTHPGLTALSGSVPQIKVPHDLEQDTSFEFAGIYFIFLNTHQFSQAKEKWLQEQLLEAGDMKWILVFGKDPVTDISYPEMTGSLTQMFDINSVSAYIRIGENYEREGKCGQQDTFYLTIPGLDTEVAAIDPTKHVASKEHVSYGPSSYSIFTLNKDRDFIRWNQISLDTFKEDDTFYIPRRDNMGNSSNDNDIKFGGAILGLLALVGVIACIMKCAAGKSEEVVVSYEM